MQRRDTTRRPCYAMEPLTAAGAVDLLFSKQMKRIGPSCTLIEFAPTEKAGHRRDAFPRNDHNRIPFPEMDAATAREIV